MLTLSNITKHYGPHTVFENVNLKISPTSRIGLVGRNGAGKSTLFRLMLGEETPEKGEVNRMPGSSIQCLTQEPKITPGNTLLEEVMSVFPDAAQAEAEEAAMMARWAEMDEAEQMAACERLAELGAVKDQLATIEADCSRMLNGLGFPMESFGQHVERFSGGWQMRINLAKVLLQKPDFLLLDEPTNHLDLDAREWLENFLHEYPGGLLIVTHDKLFLDKVVNEIAELELGRLTVWPGNYTQAMQHKAEAHEKLQAAAARQQKELAKQQEFVDRFRASATKSTQAKSREKQLAKVEKIEVPPPDKSRMSVRFPSPPFCGREVLTLQQVKKAFGPKTLFNGLNVGLERGQRVFLLGPNGAGKTTLLRLILGIEPADSGEVKLGESVEAGYFSQHQLETLNPRHTVLQSLEEVAPINMDQTEVRGVLGRFMFKGDRVLKQVNVLSGGEKSRLALARLVLGKANLLLLDEPTNHMDIPAQEVMGEAFKSYEGSLLCISHDRGFIQTVATDIWELYRGELITYEGDYDYYLSKRDEFRAKVDKRLAKAAPVEKAPKPNGEAVKQANPKREKPTEKGLDLKAIAKVEKAIEKQEAAIATLHAEIAAAATDYAKLERLGKDLQGAEAELKNLNAQWEALHGLE